MVVVVAIVCLVVMALAIIFLVVVIITIIKQAVAGSLSCLRRGTRRSNSSSSSSSSSGSSSSSRSSSGRGGGGGSSRPRRRGVVIINAEAAQNINASRGSVQNCSPTHPCKGLPQTGTAGNDGAVLRVAEHRKQPAYPALSHGGPQQLLVPGLLGSEAGGRWNAEPRAKT